MSVIDTSFPTTIIMERVQKMLDNPGFYLISDVRSPDMVMVVSSQGGKLHAWSIDQELAPDRFLPGLIIKYGPLT